MLSESRQDTIFDSRVRALTNLDLFKRTESSHHVVII